MINSTTYYDILFELSEAKEKSLEYRIKELKRVLQSIASDYTAESSIQFPSLYARLDFIFRKETITGPLKRQLSSFRFNTKNIQLISGITEGQFYGYLIAVGKLVQHLSKDTMPQWFAETASHAEVLEYTPPQAKERYDSLIGYVWDKTSTHIVLDVDEGNQFKIPFTEESINKEYQDTLDLIQVGDKLSLVDVRIDDSDNCIPLHIVYEPDYLVDISSIAECFQNIGGNEISPWQLYFIKRLISIEANPALLKGNVANFFMDELLYAPRDNQPLFADLLKSTFRNSPFEYTVLFKDDVELKEFISKVKAQFENIKRVVQLDLGSDEVGINRDNSILEPAFINEKLGLQGRLDLLDKNDTEGRIIELKSGSLPYPSYDSSKVNDNHAAQARMYRMMLKQVYGLRDDKIEAAICYSSSSVQGENIRWVPKYIEFDKRILNTRNVIVNKERELCSAEDVSVIQSFFLSLGFERLGIDLHPKLEWFRRDWDAIQTSIRKLDELERKYFFGFYQFVAQELMLSKIGDGKYSKGHSSLWNKEDVSENDESDSIEPLEVIENYSDDIENPRLVLKHTNFDPNDSFNFRKGDICVLYQKKSSSQTATAGQIYKCSVSKEISKEGVVEVVFRYKQNTVAKDKIFNNESTWCLEHDSLDHSFTSMFKGLLQFTHTDKSRRETILGRTKPAEYTSLNKELVKIDENANEDSRKEQNQILNEAIAAKDYYLLVGPPGTGKTSIMLKHLVREIHNTSEGNILVLAYTNRAVDEICESVNNAIINFDDKNDGRVNWVRTDRNFIRIGSRLSTSEEHHHNLLSVISEGCTTRAELVGVLDKHRVFVSTVSSIVHKTELFKIKQFDTVIIDEASQILEPQLIGLLGYFKKFILIGDHKQLPAVSLQGSSLAKRAVGELTSLGMLDLRESYFERLLRIVKQNNWNHAHNMLSYQGRMHKSVATFPNHCFYGSKLKIAGLPHQKGDLPFAKFNSSLQQFLGSERMLFIPSRTTEGNNRKVNEFEAQATALIVKEVIELYNANSGSVVGDDGIIKNIKFDAAKSIGIITPYRNQISRIKKELEKLELPDWESIAVDTVERYQGSQRDIIILSLCVNSLSQLEFLAANLTYDDETGELVDRKLNVALTRAREQMILVGNPYFISNVPLYYRLIQFIKSRGGLIEEGVDGIIVGNIDYKSYKDVSSFTTEAEIQIPSDSFKEMFEEIVINPIKANSPDYPNNILGYDTDYNRTTVIGYGRANFDETIITHSPEGRTLLYCYYNMRKHYFSQLAIFNSFDEFFGNELKNNSNKLAFFDWGCGPCTAGIALQSYLEESENKCLIEYFGIDISQAMLDRAKSFLDSSMFGPNFTYNLVHHVSDIETRKIEDALTETKLCIFNFSYFFGNINAEQAKVLAEFINSIIGKYPLNKFSVLFQNSALERRNHTYNVFKRTLKHHKSILSRKEEVSYKNQVYYSNSVKEKVFYELLEL
jgi:DNA replication ATP-dependent helicase Dna2